MMSFPHCDQRILHAPTECEYCDDHADWQALRTAWGIAFTGHKPDGEWITTPCPADAARPAGSRADHRRWGGNKPTTAKGDPSWPMESTASLMMYGDDGGRAAWPLTEVLAARVTAPWRHLRMRLRGWRRDGAFWRYP